ncbi:MAG TPA: segregation/condensation protein A [Candidatus Dormibacteraeota bacterium]|nr:segregation/condensation protein A [Candidatus Dormibacteraeota bacterium]
MKETRGQTALTAPPRDAAAAEDGEARGMSLIRVALPAFTGPLDLLLHLIQRDEVEITDIPIARITREYLDTLELMRELDLEVAGEFLVMAATLMRIKVRMLLPPAIADEEEEDPREGLVRQLLEYRRFKEASREFEALETERRLLFDRGAPAQLEDPQDGELQPVSLFRLLDALKNVLQRQVPAIVHTITAEPISLEEAIAVIRGQLERGKRALFEEVLSGFVSRLEKITAFLGLLELLKQEQITVSQEELFGPIWIVWRADSARRPVDSEEEEQHADG